MSLVEHAKREIDLLPENDEGFKKAILNAVKAFSEYGHSGSSAFFGMHLLHELLQFRNLTPLTNDPDEWIHHAEEVSGVEKGVWQSTRCSEAFSNNGGKTFYLLSEGANFQNPKPWHRTRKVV
jgi:hypothetical protein